MHDVPYLHQGHVNLCGDACVEMIRRYYGQKSDRPSSVNSAGVEYLVENPRGPFKGLSKEEIQEEIADLDFELQAQDKFHKTYIILKRDLSKLIQQGPLLFSYAETGLYGHYVVIAGVVGDELIVHDPWSGGSEIRPIRWLNDLIVSGDAHCIFSIKPKVKTSALSEDGLKT